MPKVHAPTPARAKIAAEEPDHNPDAIPKAKKVALIAERGDRRINFALAGTRSATEDA
jgi:hypothetical protein